MCIRDRDSTVSMNFWGFTPAIFDEIERRFPDFLAEGCLLYTSRCV